MRTTVTYLFDPLCGWCYGASPVIEKLTQQATFDLELLPTGLFAGGGRVMDVDFAAYAWANDQRIEKLTGQPFTQAYRTQVLGNLGGSFDSTAATLALTAVMLTEPQREYEALSQLQEGRYIHGLDTSSLPVVAQLLQTAGLNAAATLLMDGNANLRLINTERLQRAKGLLETFGVQGVPNLVVTDKTGDRLLPAGVLHADFEQLLHMIHTPT